MREFPTVTKRQGHSLRTARSAAMCAHLAQDPHAIYGGLPKRDRPDRLAWPVAAVAILAVSSGLWLVVAGVARLILG